MPLINQPFDGQMGDILMARLQEDYDRLTMIVAFAKNSGVLRLRPALERFRENGGTVHVFVGVDLQGTSYEALQNLLPICDSLYVVHSENSATTFHPKVYLLENDTDIWMAVGSNNLTGGGLWTNFESCQCTEYTRRTPECDEQLAPFNTLIARYIAVDYECSRRIQNKDDLDELERAGYLVREFRMRVNQQNERARRARVGRPALFGQQRGVGLPRLQVAEPGSGVQIRTGRNGGVVQATHIIEATDANERIWFETRSMTGGSRNILDLSKLGRVVCGSGAGSRYEMDDPQYILGGVVFFDIEPDNTDMIKEITVNYDGVDYHPCTILFAPNNGSWRIQLRGFSPAGQAIQTLHELGWLVNKILVFEKIRTDYYSLSVLNSGEREVCQGISYVVARNGSGNNSKLYGLFDQ